MDLDDFGDDGLDELPDNTLRELEQHAWSSTQKFQQASASEANARRVGTSRPTQRGNNNVPPPSAPEPPSSDYGFDDEDVIDLDEPSMVIQAASDLPARTRTAAKPRPRQTLDAETEAAFAAADAELGTHRPGQWTAAPHLQLAANASPDAARLQARIASLEAEHERLRASEQRARDALLAKQGEISIVRANQDKASREYEGRISAMLKLHADEVARQKAELEAGRKEREKMETDNRFLHHDLAQEAERSKRLNGPGKTRSANALQGRETPRKARRAALGDGFDDDEVMKSSPTRNRGKPVEPSPKTGLKRKRMAQDSPVAELSFSQPSIAVREDSGQSEVSIRKVETQALLRPNARFMFMQRILNHIPTGERERTVETLTRHAFPSAPTKSISSILMDGLASASNSQEHGHLPLELSRIILRIWRQCLTEKHFAFFVLILDLLRLTLRSELSSTASELVEEAVPLCVQTVDLIAVPIARASSFPTSASVMNQSDVSPLADQIDVDEVLDLLQHLCQAACLLQNRIEAFWRAMDFTFLLLMLHKAQPLSQIICVLQILPPSPLQSTFGPIARDPDQQARQEHDIIDRLTNLLFEIPEVPKDEPPYSDEEIAELRMEVLGVMRAICWSKAMGLRLAQHRRSIGRIVRFLGSQVCRLYSTRPTLGLERDPARPAAHDLIADTINTAVALLYHLLKTYDGDISFTAQMCAPKGGYNRFIIAMTRIAFSDQLVLDAGISDQAIEAAHTILDKVLSPEEGEAVMKAIETPRGTRSSGVGSHTGNTTEIATQSGGEDTTMAD